MAADEGPNKGKKTGPSGPAKAAAAAGATQGAAQKGGARKGAGGKSAAPKRSVRDRAIDAALALAAEIPWREVTLQDIAERADLPLADVVEEFPSRLSVVRGFMRRIDREVLNNLDPEIAGEPARERLFDVLIGRFEALNPHKAAVRSLWEALSRDPEALAMLNRTAIRSQLAMLAGAGINAEGVSGMARAQGLATIFFRTMGIWLDDEDPGMARTMAALDRRLRDAERMLRPLEGLSSAARLAGSVCAAIFGRGRGWDREEAA